MPWGRVDDTWYDHPKLDLLDDEHEWPDRLVAAGLDSLAWSWCNRFLTDGHVPSATVRKLGATREIADMLVAIGRWEEAPGGYQIHDFLVYNDSRELILERRRTEAKRKAEWRAKQREKASPSGTASVNDEEVPAGVPAGVPPPVRPESRQVSRVPRATRDVARIPTRPDPSRPVEKVPLRESQLARANGAEPTLSKTEHDAWRLFGPEWDAFRSAWIGRGLRLPPSGDPDGDDTSQRGMLWQVLDARPTDLVRWVREARGRTSHEVVAHVLDRWHEVRVEAELADETPGMAGGPPKTEAAESLSAILARLGGAQVEATP